MANGIAQGDATGGGRTPRPGPRRWIVLPLALLLLAGLCLTAGPGIARRGVALFYARAFGNVEHFLPCADLPEAGHVEQVLRERRDLVERIEQVNPGHIFVYADSSRCPGKADIVILFATLQDSRAIRRILGDGTFLGIPYRMYNT